MESIESLFFVNLNKFKKYNEKQMNEVMEKYNLRKIDVQIMVYLSTSEGYDTAKDLADTAAFTKGHISQSVKRLTEMKFIIIERDKNDQRVQHLILTPAAKTAMEGLIKEREKAIDAIFEGFSEKEKQELFGMFKKLSDNVSKLVND